MEQQAEMTDHAALVAGILAAPTDDLPRLVFADYVEEHGDGERGRYVRASVELNRLVEAEDYDEEHMAVVSAVAAVPAPSLWRWAADDGLPQPAGPFLVRDTSGAVDLVRDANTGVAFGYRRGFVEVVRCPSAYWEPAGAALVRRAPISRVELTDKRPHRLPRNEWLWRREADGVGDEHNGLPAAVFDRLGVGQSVVAVYHTRRAALDALSAACVAAARVAAR
jgi:uncharacterized protein (TIGR02996 family)